MGVDQDVSTLRVSFDGARIFVQFTDMDGNVRLQTIANPARANKDAQPRLPGDPGVTAEMLDNCQAHASNLLTLEVLVQNRRKDKKPVLVFGGQSHVVSFGKSTQDVLKGKTIIDGVTTFQLERYVPRCTVR